MDKPTFEQLPEIVLQLAKEISELRKTIQLKQKEPEKSQWFSLKQLIEYLPQKPKPTTIYGWVSEKYIPHVKRGRKLSFEKSAIDAWLISGKVDTAEEAEQKIKQERDAHLASLKRKRK